MATKGVRPASLLDIPWMLSELKRFSEFYGTKKSLYPGDEEAEPLLRGLIEGGVSYVSYSDSGDLTGFIVGHLCKHPLNQSLKILTEIFWWVAPEHRGKRDGYLLLRRFVEHGKLAADWIHVTTELKMPISDAVFSRLGLHPMEKSYLMEVDHEST